MVYPFAEATNPVSQCYLVGIFIVIRDGSHAHEPLMSYGTVGWNTMSHSKMHIACSHKLSFRVGLLNLFGCSKQTLDDQILCVVVSSSPRAKLRKETAMLEECQCLVVSIN